MSNRASSRRGGADRSKSSAGRNRGASNAPTARRKRPISQARWVLWVRAVRAQAGLLIAAFLITVVVAYGLLRLMPETFRATASLIVDPAIDSEELGRETDGSILSVPTLQNLMNQPSTMSVVRHIVALADRTGGAEAGDSDVASLGVATQEEREVIRAAYAGIAEADRQTLASALSEDYLDISIEDFGNLFEARPTVEKRLAFDVVYSPVIYLDALASDPEYARALANVWVVSFVEIFYQINRRQLEDNQAAIESAYNKAKKAWEESLRAIRAVSENETLPVIEARHQETVLGYETTVSRRIEAEREKYVLESQLVQVRQQIEFLSNERGEWVGKVDIEDLRDGAISDTAEMPSGSSSWPPALPGAGGSPKMTATYASLRTQAIRSRRELLASAQALLEFEKENLLDELNLRKGDATARLNEALRRQRQLTVEVPAMVSAITSNTAMLNAIPQTIPLKQVLPPEVLSELMLRRAEAGDTTPLDADAVTYTTEVPNPGWVKLVEDTSGQAAAFHRSQPEQALWTKLIGEVQVEIRELQSEISRYSVQKELLRQAHDEVSRSNVELNTRFTNLQTEAHDAATGIASLESEIAQLNDRLTSLTEQSTKDFATMERMKSEIAVLESTATQQKSLTDTLRTQLQSVQIQLSDNSREVKLAALAVTPEEKVFPPRTVFSLAAGMLVLLMMIGVLIIREEYTASAWEHDEAEGGSDDADVAEDSAAGDEDDA